jgi:hypothetical protein
MEVLQAHRERVERLQQALQRLLALHEERYEAWSEIVRLAKEEGDDEARVATIASRHDAIRELAGRVGALRAETFGPLSHEEELLLNSQVESTRGLSPFVPGEPLVEVAANEGAGPTGESA